jgi:prevent-host-death family protein
MNSTTFTSDDARKHWRDLLDLAHADESEIVIERYNKPVAVLLNYERYQAIKELLYELRTIRQAEKNLRTWLNNPSRGQLYTDFRRQLSDEGLLVE